MDSVLENSDALFEFEDEVEDGGACLKSPVIKKTPSSSAVPSTSSTAVDSKSPAAEKTKTPQKSPFSKTYLEATAVKGFVQLRSETFGDLFKCSSEALKYASLNVVAKRKELEALESHIRKKRSELESAVTAKEQLQSVLRQLNDANKKE